ncbi:hypothetical protein FF36_04075 [Frankia torreyi]|uniref:Uncharacterized protein n=1 Tax=Frankia torreyi TaxID=1856 RepID=A0A0D8BBG0_9ACTN|nr:MULTISPECIES: hypothetical protein [Frankia]KJE21618.1 hypothetical protein FF36_04075 [Frankia torreyi]KQC36749.1 hypothetical protein UK82_19365 [Frankia sp. ACN1ag]KQM03691.1 hypothetical protein FF86_103629 [Frankia sp. CpI1-P]
MSVPPSAASPGAPAGLAPAGAPAGHAVVRFSGDCELSPSEDRWLQEGLAAALPDLRMAELFAARPELFREADHLIVGVDRASGQPVSALGASWTATAAGERFLHIGVQFVDARVRRGPVFSTSWLALLEDVVAAGGFPLLSALRTYNPVAYCAMRAYGRLPGAVMYPEVGPVDQDPDVTRLAGEIAATLAPGAPFDPASGRIAGIGVPRGLYRGRPRCDDAAVNEHFERHTVPGDRILCVVHIRETATVDAIVDNFVRRTTRSAPGAATPADPAAPPLSPADHGGPITRPRLREL